MGEFIVFLFTSGYGFAALTGFFVAILLFIINKFHKNFKKEIKRTDKEILNLKEITQKKIDRDDFFNTLEKWKNEIQKSIEKSIENLEKLYDAKLASVKAEIGHK